MNGEVQVLKTDSSVFPLNHKADEVLLNKTAENEIIEVSVAELKISEKKLRFARLKKSLRKRSASIF
jgi:hypothetical protein